MENLVIGYSLSVLVGLSLGLLGGGGSILTVPILIYVLKIDPKLAIALSLAVVGFSGLFGIAGHLKKGNVLFKVSLVFGLFAMAGTIVGTKVAPHISSRVQLLLFAGLMLTASVLMIKKPRYSSENKISASEFTFCPKNIVLLALQAIVVGVLTGVVGVGGGFMIVPALVLLAKVPMKKAVGSSLVIIAANSISGFISYQSTMTIPWEFLYKFTGFSVIGILIGTRLSSKVPQEKLKSGFGYFLILMGLFVLMKNLNL